MFGLKLVTSCWNRFVRTLFKDLTFLLLIGEGMDEMEFTEAESNMNDLVSEYQQYQVIFVLIFFTVLNEFKPVLRIRIRWIRKILASWIRIRKNMWIH